MSDELSPSQVATRIGTTTRSVQRWIKDGRLPARRVGGRWRVASDALDAFVVPTDQWGDRPGSALGRTHGPAVRVRPVGRLLVANRGEIARRIVRTAERLGVATIVPAIDGNFDDALALVLELTSTHDVALVNSINPFRAETRQRVSSSAPRLPEAPAQKLKILMPI